MYTKFDNDLVVQEHINRMHQQARHEALVRTAREAAQSHSTPRRPNLLTQLVVLLLQVIR